MDFYTHAAIKSATLAAEKIFGGQTETTEIKVRKNEIDPPAGIELSSYVHREASEDGTFVIVKEHLEWIQGVPQPPTEAEITARRLRIQAENVRLQEQSKIALGVGLAATATFGVLYVFRDRLLK